MKFLFIFFAFILLVATATIFYFIGVNTGNKKAHLVYLPSKTKPLNNFIGGPYNINTTGRVKTIDNNSITLEDLSHLYSATFQFESQPAINIQFIASSPASLDQDYNSFKITQTKSGKLTDIQPGEEVTLNLSLSKDSITLKSILIRKELK